MLKPSLIVVSFACVACTGGEQRAPSGPTVGITVAPLVLPGVVEVCYGLTVYNDVAMQPSDEVWAEGDVCSIQFGNGGGGDIAYVGPCDAATLDAGDDLNYVQLVLTTIEVGAGQGSYPIATKSFLDDQLTTTLSGGPRGYTADGDADFQNPCLAPGDCVLVFECEENRDVRVTFDLTVMVDAEQGFFDIAVNFDDIFCSAKVDCAYANGDPIEAVFDPATGERVRSVVWAFACTDGDPDDLPATSTHLYMNPIELDCGATSYFVDPSAGPGKIYELGDPVPPPLVQAMVFEGAEVITNGGLAADKRYWSVALGLNASFLSPPSPAVAPSCVLKTSATASRGPLAGGQTPLDSNYPYIAVEVPINQGSTVSCTRHGLDSDNGVGTAYTGPRPDHTGFARKTFAYAGAPTVAGLATSNIDDCLGNLCGLGACVDGLGAYACDCPDGTFGDGTSACTGCTALDHCTALTCTSPADSSCTTCASGFVPAAGVCVDHNDCAPNPCAPGACTDDGTNAWHCACPDGYYGDNATSCGLCSAVANCLAVVCTATGASQCVTCANGYAIDNGACVLVDDCIGHACGPGACTDGVNTYTCACPDGHFGDGTQVCTACTPLANCEQGALRCTTATTPNCFDCVTGWAGATCDVDLDECDPNPCFNGGACSDEVDGYECACPNGFTGDRCQVNIDDCPAQNLCLNGGTCADGVNEWSCSCAAGYIGTSCEIDNDPCTPNCQNGGTCTQPDLICDCTGTGFEGPTCTNYVDDCSPNPCLAGFICIDGFKTYTCTTTGPNFSNQNLSGVNLSNHNLAGALLINTNLMGANLTNTNLTNANLHVANLTNANLTGANLTGAQVTGVTWTGAILERTNLTGANFYGKNLTNANMIGAILSGADFTQAVLTGADLTGATLVGANLYYGDLTNADFTGADLTDARLSRTTLTGTIFTGATLIGTSWSWVNLTGRDFSGYDLSRTGFYGANLNQVRFIATNLTGADLRTAFMTGTDLTNANLTNADLRDVDNNFTTLKDAIVAGVDWTGARLTGVEMRNVDLSGIDWNGIDLTGARFYNCNFTDASLNGTTLVGARLTGSNFFDADLIGADLSNITAYSIQAVSADLNHATMSGHFHDSNFTGANLSYANAAAALFYYGTYINANMTGINLYPLGGFWQSNVTGVIWTDATCGYGTVVGVDGVTSCP